MNKIGTLVICLTTLALFAQAPVKEPEFADTFAAVSASGDLIPLEHQAARIHAGGGGFMIASSKAAYEISGQKSPVRFHQTPESVFIVRSALAQTDTNPATLYVLRKLDPKKKTREIAFSTGHFTPLGGHATTDLNAGQIPNSFARYGTFPTALPPRALLPVNMHEAARMDRMFIALELIEATAQEVSRHVVRSRSTALTPVFLNSRGLLARSRRA